MIQDPNYIPVEGHANFVRDASTGAIINIDKSKATKARKAREKVLREKEEIKELKNDVAEIKSLLKQLLER
jgi:hypothetical protein